MVKHFDHLSEKEVSSSRMRVKDSQTGIRLARQTLVVKMTGLLTYWSEGKSDIWTCIGLAEQILDCSFVFATDIQFK